MYGGQYSTTAASANPGPAALLSMDAMMRKRSVACWGFPTGLFTPSYLLSPPEPTVCSAHAPPKRSVLWDQAREERAQEKVFLLSSPGSQHSQYLGRFHLKIRRKSDVDFMSLENCLAGSLAVAVCLFPRRESRHVCFLLLSDPRL